MSSTPADEEPTCLSPKFILHYNTHIPLIKYSPKQQLPAHPVPQYNLFPLSLPYNMPTAATAKTPSPANAPPVAMGAALSDCEAAASLPSLSLSLPLELPPEEPPLDPLPLPPLLLLLLLSLSLSVAAGRVEVMVVGPFAPDEVMTVVFDPPVVPLMPMPPGVPVERAVVMAPVPMIWACEAASRAEVARMEVKCILAAVKVWYVVE